MNSIKIINHNHVFQVNSQQVMPQFTKLWLQLCPCNLKNTITDRCVSPHQENLYSSEDVNITWSHQTRVTAIKTITANHIVILSSAAVDCQLKKHPNLKHLNNNNNVYAHFQPHEPDKAGCLSPSSVRGWSSAWRLSGRWCVSGDEEASGELLIIRDPLLWYFCRCCALLSLNVCAGAHLPHTQLYDCDSQREAQKANFTMKNATVGHFK